MDLPTKIEKAGAVIGAALKRFRNPAVMCSFGKDSLVVLHLVRQVADLPVIFHREPFQPHRYTYAQRVIEQWGLTVYDFPPVRTEVQEGGGEIEVMNHYPIGQGTCALPTGLVEPQPGEPWVCALRDIYGKPTGTFGYYWDAVFHGHKSVDRDPILGAVPLHADYALNVASATGVFPIREWTDDDVWEYLEMHGVPLHLDRYEKVDGRWREKTDRTRNPDYIAACSACMRSDGARAVACPKVAGQLVQNVAGQLRRVKPLNLTYTG